tara:strand:+ start:122 stop:679 length:558 start_codon:yes stop_codon:yes gene_type:complete
MKKLLVAIYLIICVNPVFASDFTVLPKADAASMFSMSLEAWKENVIGLKSIGKADYDTNGTDEYTLMYDTEIYGTEMYDTGLARVVTTPSYSKTNISKPWKLSVAIIHNPEASAFFNLRNKDGLKGYIASIYEEMLPEYTVFTKVISSSTKVIHEYQIFEYGYDETVDEYAAIQKGCFMECIEEY